jgi:cytidylate kinase
MEVNQQTIAAMRAVTVSREYGSGGGEIAARLARRLGWQLVDHEVIAQVARELEIPEAEAEAHDERVESRIARILHRIRLSVSGTFTTPIAGAPLGTPFLAASASPAAENPSLAAGATPPAARERVYQDTLRHVVQVAASTGHAVIVGRGGQVILAGQREVLHVRVVAPFEQRVGYVALREGLDEAAARVRTQQKDQARTRYMQTLYHCQHDDPRLYDLVINTGHLVLESAVDLIYLALESKAKRLSVPVAELGPAAGMTRYTGQPADFPVPPRSSS